jgi:hypothetical protein
MKSHRLTTYARIALITAAAGLMTACVSSPHYYDPDPYYSPRAVYYDYWYYPAIGAYYDPSAHIYIYHEHDHWIRARALPPRMRPHLGHHVTVRSPHERPYEEHNRHREQYQPERYRERDPAQHGDDVWIGAPHQPSPQRDRDDRRIESRDRDRNDKDWRHEPERGAVAVPPRYREPDVKKYPRQAPDTRPKDTPRHREPPASAAPIKRVDKWRQPEIHREKSREQYRNVDTRRDNERNKDQNRSGSRTGQAGQDKVPDVRGQHPKTPAQAAPGHRAPPTKTVPAKRDDKGHQREIRKDETRGRNREGDDFHNEDDATSQQRQRGQFDQYEQ